MKPDKETLSTGLGAAVLASADEPAFPRQEGISISQYSRALLGAASPWNNTEKVREGRFGEEV
ncbi:hypothetical protein PQQ96_41520 [Paraburkholderia sediminicola]|uniref:hypothetical protein n=1 Tax=Paraburkholderia sediminicola TaxID=458836 RepID=UPI0038BC9E09